MARRHELGRLFYICKVRAGRYRACADLQPGTKGLYRYCRDAVSRDAAHELLLCLRRELVERSGPVVPVLEMWRFGLICG